MSGGQRFVFNSHMGVEQAVHRLLHIGRNGKITPPSSLKRRRDTPPAEFKTPPSGGGSRRSSACSNSVGRARKAVRYEASGSGGESFPLQETTPEDVKSITEFLKQRAKRSHETVMRHANMATEKALYRQKRACVIYHKLQPEDSLDRMRCWICQRTRPQSVQQQEDGAPMVTPGAVVVTAAQRRKWFNLPPDPHGPAPPPFALGIDVRGLDRPLAISGPQALDTPLKMQLRPGDWKVLVNGTHGIDLNAVVFTWCWMSDVWRHHADIVPRNEHDHRIAQGTYTLSAYEDVSMQTFLRAWYMYLVVVCDPHVRYPRRFWQTLAAACLLIQFRICDDLEHDDQMSASVSAWATLMKDPRGTERITGMMAWLAQRFGWVLHEMPVDFMRDAPTLFARNQWMEFGARDKDLHRATLPNPMLHDWRWFERDVLAPVFLPSPRLSTQTLTELRDHADFEYLRVLIRSWFGPPEMCYRLMHERAIEQFHVAVAKFSGSHVQRTYYRHIRHHLPQSILRFATLFGLASLADTPTIIARETKRIVPFPE